MSYLNPDPEKLPGIFAGLPDNTPIVMLNLLKFRDVAVYKGQPADYSGREAYRRYSDVALQKLAEIGARVTYVGNMKATLIGPESEQWDEVLLVRYPSKQAFLGMMMQPDFFEATRHRTAALADSRLVATIEATGP